MYVPHDNGFFVDFEGNNRFDLPNPLYRVTAGFGGEVYLIVGSKRTVLYDCGMACLQDKVISNIHEVLDKLERKLDYIALSHTHYDHVGALPYIISEFPDAIVMGSPYCAKVFNSEGAIRTMEELGQNARDLYNVSCPAITARGMKLDMPLHDGQEIDLGDVSIKYYEAKGHTECSCVYMILPQRILLSNESLAQVEAPSKMSTSPLKSFSQCIESAIRIKALNPEYIISMHYGKLPKWYNDDYFDQYIEELKFEYKLIVRGIENGLTDDEISDVHDKIYWNEDRRLNQPYDAHHLNTMIIITKVRKEVQQNAKL